MSYLKYGKEFGIRADFLFAQACFETDFFRFTGRVLPAMHNLCGLRKSDGDFYTFPTIEAGALAHVAHVASYLFHDHVNKYCTTPYDPKHPTDHYDWAKTVRDFSGKWAPSADYAANLLKRWNGGA